MIPASKVREYLDYHPETGRLVRVKRKTCGVLGVPIGVVGGSRNSTKPYRRAYFKNKRFQTSHLVWAWHNGSWPESNIIRKNGDTLDDRIENLVQYKDLRRPVSVASLLSPEDQPKTMLGDLPSPINTGIYEIRNIMNGRKYIGSAVNISKRWREHLRQLENGIHHSRFMQRCWNKHGEGCFIFRVLLACSKEDLIMYEQSCLDYYKPEYNSAKIAGSQLGHKHSLETRKKMSKARRKDFSPMTGRKHSEETKKRISKSKTGVKHGKYNKDRIEKASLIMRESKGALLEEDVRQIRNMRSNGKTYVQIASEIGCSWYVVADVIQGRTFKWVN